MNKETPELKTYVKVDLEKEKVVETPEVLEHGKDLVENQLSTIVSLGADSMAVERAIKENKAIANIIKNALVEGSHYGFIPGTQTKTLFQPGADVLARTYGIEVEIIPVDKTIDVLNGYLDFEFKGVFKWQGKVLLTDFASANSYEQKFRSHFQKYDRKTETWNNIPGKSAFDIKNTLQQMGSKRVYVRGIRKVLGLTAEFTQDLEEMGGPLSSKDDQFAVWDALYKQEPFVSILADKEYGANKDVRKAWIKEHVLKPTLEVVGAEAYFKKWTKQNVDDILEYLNNSDYTNKLVNDAKEKND